MVIVLVSVGAVAIAATTAYVVRYRRRVSAYERTVSKLGETKQLKQPLPSKMKGAISAESEVPSYVLPRDSRNLPEIADKLNNLPFLQSWTNLP